MKIDDIFNMWHQDVEIDESNLSYESLRIPSLHQKYLKIFYTENTELQKQELFFKKALKIKSEYYRGVLPREELEEYNLPPLNQKILREDVTSYLESDNDLQKLKIKIIEQKEKVEVLKEIIKSLNNRNFNIKNAMDFLRFTQGS